MSIFGRKGGSLDGIRTEAARVNKERKHHEHEEHEEGAKDGKRAALADLPRIIDAIHERQHPRMLGSRRLGKKAAREGDGAHTWIMPSGFKSALPGLPHGGRITYGSHAFVEEYVETLREELNKDDKGHAPTFHVYLDGHGVDAKILIGWKSQSSSH